MGLYASQPFPYTPPRELSGGVGSRHPVVIVGAGPVGLAAAIDLAQQGVRSVVLDDNDVVSVGSRAICWSKRTLEIFDRLGVAGRMVEKGVTWQIGRVYHREQELYSFNLLPEHGHKMPAFINLQQYYVEEYLVARAADFPDLIDLRWKNKVSNVRQLDDGVAVNVGTPDGRYELQASWLIAADGARSTVRELLDLPFEGHVFEEKFLIADIELRNADFPSDRRFWFQPAFDPGESVLIHRQPDNSFRIDFQLGWEADAELERQPERVGDRVRSAIGADADFRLDWCSVYTFRCARLERFVHGRIIFVGDSAHVVSPFGARGGNGGIQDIDNLCWKLALVLKGDAPQTLIESYDDERMHGCDENIVNSSRTTRFMTPKTPVERQLRDAVLTLAREFPFARALVNAGRLSRPCSYEGLRTVPADDRSMAGPPPGAPCLDAPVTCRNASKQWLLELLDGGFSILTFLRDATDVGRRKAELNQAGIELPLWGILPVDAQVCGTETSPDTLIDVDGLLHERYGGAPGVTYLIRPDQHVAARFRSFDVNALAAAHSNAVGRSL
jgi:3-(3-hydroxy-phenyl)propionate hydroxylase